MKKMKKIYDFRDFADCVQNARKTGQVHQMRVEDFRDWKDYSSLHKLKKIQPRPYLCDMVQVFFTRGSCIFEYSTSFGGELIGVDFLKNNYQSQITKFRTTWAEGASKRISKVQKNHLIQSLRPIMPKLDFWLNLPESESSADLRVGDDPVDLQNLNKYDTLDRNWAI